ncbi:MAG: DUF4398 domain-containing protein [Treponema sp.]|nr:DUF4398 domain-containing protein [Treponema sp.]
MKKHIAINTLGFALVLTVGLAFLAACVTPPLEEMNQALDAVTRAENDPDAVAFAPELLIRARTALNQMQAEADAKRYDAARDFAAEAIFNAERAISEGRIASGRGRDEATSLIDSLAGPINETAAAISAAEQLRLQLDFDSLNRDMDLARRTYDDAREDLRENRFRDAIARGQTIRPLLSDINARLGGAAQAISRK